MGERLGLGLFQWPSVAKDNDPRLPRPPPNPCPFCSAWDDTEDSGSGGGAGMWARGQCFGIIVGLRGKGAAQVQLPLPGHGASCGQG